MGSPYKHNDGFGNIKPNKEQKCPLCGKLTKRVMVNWIDWEGEEIWKNRKIMRGCIFCYMKWKAEKQKITEPNEDSDDIL